MYSIFLFEGNYSPYRAPCFSFSSVIIFYTDGKTPWTINKPVARPLPIHRTTQTQNKRILKHSFLEWDSNPRSQRPSAACILYPWCYMKWNGRAIAQAVSRRLPTAAARVKTRVWSCGILWWTKVALVQVFSQNFGFPCQSTFHLLLHNHLHYHPRLAQ
jgi:hypothetical protein